MRVALVTSKDLPNLAEDDRLLLPELDRIGIQAEPAVWSEERLDWEGFDAAVLRSPWDYFLRWSEFQRWFDRVEQATTVWNSPRTVRWNSHKSYLFDLERAGVPIIPTARASTLAEARGALAQNRWQRVVIKPVVSANAFRTVRVEGGDETAFARAFAEASQAGEVLVQPYMTEVERSGERSLVFIDSQFSHAFLKAPRLVAESPLRYATPCSATPEEVGVGERAVACAPERTLYARVDMVPDPPGPPRVMEVEMFEPDLEFRVGGSVGAARKFAHALHARL